MEGKVSRSDLKRVVEIYKRQVYKKDPQRWMVDRFGMEENFLDWESWDRDLYANHKWDGDRNPFLKAMNVLAKNGIKDNWVAIESATGCGKTYFLARLIYWFLDCFEGALVITTAPTMRQLKMVLWSEVSRGFKQFKIIRKDAELQTTSLYPEGKGVKKTEDGGDITINDHHVCYGITAGGSSSDEASVAFQGLHKENMLIVLEECAGINYSILNSIIGTSGDHRNHVVAVGNPDSITDSLHRFSEYPRTVPIRISSYDHPNVVLNKRLIPGAIMQDSIEAMKEEYGEGSNFFNSRARGISPKEGSSSLIKYDWIAQCCIIKPEYEKNGPIEYDNVSRNALGIDVANSEEGDKACLGWGKRNELVKLHEFRCPNANHLAYNVMFDDMWLLSNDVENYDTDKISDYNIDSENIGVDSVGVGVATLNTLADHNYEVISLQGGQWVECIRLHEETEQPMYNFQNLRAQMYYQLAIDLQSRDFRIALMDPTEVSDLIKEAGIPKMIVSGGKIAIEKKDDIKKKLGHSPNKLDTLAYWNWVRKDRSGTVPAVPLPEPDDYEESADFY